MLDQLDADAALDALGGLEKVTATSIKELSEVQTQLEAVRQRRRHGWSWRRISTSSGAENPLALVTSITSQLGRARRGLPASARSRAAQLGHVPFGHRTTSRCLAPAS